MTTESFEHMRKRVIQLYKRWIVRSALRGHKNKGRGLVLVKYNKVGMVRLSYLTLDKLKQQHLDATPEEQHGRAMLVKKISAYHPDSEIAVVFTDGVTERLSFGVRIHATG
jgi:hypothetical protein